MTELLDVAVIRNIKYLLLCRIDDGSDGRRLLVSIAVDLVADADKTAKRRFILDYSGVILYVCRRGNRFCNQRDILNAACLISITLLYEGVDEGDGIDHLALRIHTKERGINVLMLLKVEVVRADHTADLVEAFGLD